MVVEFNGGGGILMKMKVCRDGFGLWVVSASKTTRKICEEEEKDDKKKDNYF